MGSPVCFIDCRKQFYNATRPCDIHYNACITHPENTAECCGIHISSQGMMINNYKLRSFDIQELAFVWNDRLSNWFPTGDL